MGLRGFPPKPTALKILDGNPGKRPLNKREPQPADSQVHCPASLSAEARLEWRRLAPVLRRMKVLTEADVGALADLCKALALLRRAETELDETGLTIRQGAVARVKTNPLFEIRDRLASEVLRLYREFGLTPSSRSRLQISGASERRPKDGVLNGEFTPDETFSRTPSGAVLLGEGGDESGPVLQ